MIDPPENVKRMHQYMAGYSAGAQPNGYMHHSASDDFSSGFSRGHFDRKRALEQARQMYKVEPKVTA
jgi:poly(3-hydroxybutyrate) depolymerase